jgi:tRNA(Ile)-lysidine synthase
MKQITDIVTANLKQHCAAGKGEKIVVGLSGGADSIALTHILISLGYSVAAAHCNFSLRGDESDADEAFVRKQCKEWNIGLHTIRFDTQATAKNENISIEMAARKLRYRWFEEIMAEHGYDLLAIGHHADDSAETFFLNLTRGTGIRGLSGIKYRNGNIIRPMLNLSRQEIEEYCKNNNLRYVTDSTNAEEHYLRNKIRHSVIPVLKSINPSFLETMTANMKRLSDIADMIGETVNQFKSEAVGTEENCTLVSKRILMEKGSSAIILFEIMSEFGFTSSTISDMHRCLKENLSGRQFFSPGYRAIIDRHNIVILHRDTSLEEQEYYIEQGEETILFPVELSLKEYARDENFEVEKSKNAAFFDADLLNFPLTIRKWHQGDTFKPFGMSGFKKLSDYFVDQKFRIDQKEEAWLLVSGNDIIWIIGNRTDDRYKISNRTKNILEIRTGRKDIV